VSKIDAVTIKTHMGKIPQKYSSTVPRWKIRMDPLLLNLPKSRFCHAYAYRDSPLWLVMWPDEVYTETVTDKTGKSFKTERRGLMDWMSDDDFLGSYQASNQEARLNLSCVSLRRDVSKAIDWRTA
jgi:hypothetical protein